MQIKQLIQTNDILIVSGEGEVGGTESYNGTRTMRAIKSRLTRERCHGDRWARALVYSHDAEHGRVYVDVMTGEPELVYEEIE